MSALRFSTPGQLAFLDLGPATATTNAHVGGYRVVGTSERDRANEAQRAYRARQRSDARLLNDPDFIGTPEGQRWLEDLNRKKDQDRRYRG